IGEMNWSCLFFFQAEDGIRDRNVTGVQTCALPICGPSTLAIRSEASFNRSGTGSPIASASRSPTARPCTGNLSAPPDRMPHPPHDVDAKSHSSIDLGRSLRLYEQAAIHVTRAQRLVVGADAP